MTPSKSLFYFCLSFILGVFLASVTKIPQALIWAFLVVGVLLIVTSFWKKYFLVIGFCVLVLCLGVLRCQISFYNIQNNNLIKLNDKPEVVTLVGKIVGDPDNRDAGQKLKFQPDNFEGLILITKPRYPEYNYLDKIKITGKLKTPGHFSDEVFSESYKNYLLKDGVYSVMDFPKIELISTKHDYNLFSWTFEKILIIKQNLRESIRQNYSPPGSLIMEGTILGDNNALDSNLKNQFNITGLRHIIAVSGTHVVILCSILVYLFLAMGFWRSQAFYGATVFIWLYVLLTGLPASGVRAGIMITLVLLAQKLGRQSNNYRIIFLAGALILLQNPLLLMYDAGFQLSFLAVLGLVYLESFIKSWIIKLFRIKNEKLENIAGMVAATISAQIFTIPVMLYNFGNISFMAPITNILILPVVEYLMIFGFLSAIAGVFIPWLGFVISIPCQILLAYFVKVLEIFSQPWAMKTFANVHWIWLVILYFWVGLFTAWVKKRERESKMF